MWGYELPEWFAAQGGIAWPLLLCSVITLAVLLERALVLLLLPSLAARDLQFARQQCGQPLEPRRVRRFSWQQGVDLLRSHRGVSKLQREDLVSVWLLDARHYLQRRLRLLQLISVMSPMVGLLGTVLGLLVMFAGIAESDKAVTPSVLADGLFQALYSTARGLIVAIAALGGGQALGLLGTTYIERMQQLLNRCLLMLDGIGDEIPATTVERPVAA